MSNGNVYTLRQDNISHDTVKGLGQLYRGARRGQVQGCAFIAFLPEREYIANACGIALANPALSVLLLRDLDAKLVAHVKGLPDSL